MLQSILANLIDANIVSVVTTEEYKLSRYQPAVDTDLLTTTHVLQTMEDLGVDGEINILKTDAYAEIEKGLLINDDRLLKEI